MMIFTGDRRDETAISTAQRERMQSERDNQTQDDEIMKVETAMPVAEVQAMAP
jgi:hypothetical protein